MREAVIVSYGRSAIGKAPRGTLRHVRPESLAAQVIEGTLGRLGSDFPRDCIEDLVLGCAFPEAEQGINMARIVALKSQLAMSVPGQTVNRFCASGLQAVATAASSIIAGYHDVVLAGGVECMSVVPMGGNLIFPDPDKAGNQVDAYMAMGLTAENVAEKYQISRELQDEFSYKSHVKAMAAQDNGQFARQIIPVEVPVPDDGSTDTPGCHNIVFEQDEGIRRGISHEGLAALKPVFKMGGTVTAGNSSQTSDGAAMALIMEKERALALDVRPIAGIVSFAVVGLDPAYMGMGPSLAIPKALKAAGLSLKDVDLFEINEAFASQAVACIRELGLDEDRVNVQGGAIALGHPLGCTGGFLLAKLLSEMETRQSHYGIVSMCVGGGMGAASVLERLG